MGRENKEGKPKWDIDNEYPKWDPIDYKFQDAQFFSKVRKLLLERLEPEHDLMDEHLTITDITWVFGNVKVFKTINPLLLASVKKEIEMLY